MHRLLLLAIAVSAAACTSEPSTDPGQIVRIQDRWFDACHEGNSATCSIEVTFADGQFTALGRYLDGSAGPTASGTVTDAGSGRLAELISHVPLESPDTIHDPGCGGPPPRVTNADHGAA